MSLICGKSRHFGSGFQAGLITHILCSLFPDTAEIFHQEISKFLVTCHGHPFKLSELYPVRVRLDCDRAGNDFLAHALERERFIVELHPEPRMGVHHGSVLEILEEFFLCRHRAFEFDLYPGSVNPVPLKRMLGDNVRFIGLDLYLDLTFVCRFLYTSAGDHNSRNATGELSIKHRGRNPDSLLPACLPDLVEPGAVKKFSKDKRHLGRYNTGTVIFDNNPENIV